MNLLVQVNNATNPMLGQNGQGVCGVVLNFQHDYLSDLEITLTSPAGQSVTLVGPSGFYDPTTFTFWNVTFLQCGDAPDPDAGFEPEWANDQPWGSLGSFTGNYHPYFGCLENFNTGPVNGTWTLTVTDVQEDDLGYFLDYQIIFCDPSGINCFNCAADAGNLLQPDLNVCATDDTLSHLTLPPAYPSGTLPPPAAQYGYRYVLSGMGGVLLGYLDALDLSQRAPGTYTLCGLSYLKTQAAQLPAPNGTFTVQQLAASLNSSNPPFCGDMTSNCVNIQIKAVPPNTLDTVTVCYPECYTFGGNTICEEGYFTDTLQQNGCTYMSTILLVIQRPDTVYVQESICTGQCSATPGFEQNCTAGTYTRVFQTQAGCDSTVVLDLHVLDVQALIAPPDTLECNVPTVALLGNGSSVGADVTYRWTAKAGGVLAGPIDEINATASRPGIYQLRVCRSDSTGALCCDSVNVQVRKRNVPPLAPGPITGLPVLCLGQTATYSIASVTGATVYNWIMPPGSTLLSGQGDTSVTILWNSQTAAAICVTSTDSCGNLSTPRCRIIQTGQVAPPVQIPLGDVTACRDSAGKYHIPPFTGATDYVWSVNAPHTLVQGQGTPDIEIQWGNAPTAAICVQVTNPCGTSAPGCTQVTLTTVPAAPVLAGDTLACQTDTLMYSIASGGGGTSVLWSVTGGRIVGGQNSPQIQVVWDSPLGMGTVCATAANDCGTSVQSCQEVRFGFPPSIGVVTRLCDTLDPGVYQVVFPVLGGTGPFVVAGGLVSGGLFTSDPIPNGVPYSFTLTDAYGCFSEEVKGKYNCNCTSSAGLLGNELLKICEGGQVTVSVSGGKVDLNDLSLFVLHSDSASVLGTAIAQNSTGIFSLLPGMDYGIRYYVTHLVGDPLNGVPDPDDPCYSISNTQPMVFLKNPMATGGDDQAICGKTASLAATGIGTWTIDKQPANATGVFSDAVSPFATLTVDSAGTYDLFWTVLDSNGCVGQDEVQAVFHPLPVLANLTRICDAANQNYVVMVTLSGGTPPYNVGGTFISGNVFVSPPIANGQSFSFSLGDTMGCTLPPVSGAYDCACTSDAGTMSAQPLTVCASDMVVAQANQDAQPDPDDVVGFVLHDGSGGVLGNVLAYNNTGTFSFLPNMQYGQAYYLSRTLGNSLNGLPNPADPCFSVAVGQPVIFYEAPQPQAGQDTLVCGLDITLLAATSPYPGGWSLASGPGTAIFTSPFSRETDIEVSVTGTYRLVWTERNGPCQVADTVSVGFYALPAFDQFQETCNGTNTGYSLQWEMVSGQAPFSITGLAGAFTGTSFLSQELAVGQSYLFFITDAHGCRGLETFGAHACDCITDAGTIQSTSSVQYCAGEAASAIWNNNPTLDADDVVEFVLHDKPDTQLGTILARSTQPIFPYQPGFLTGFTYYISAVAGSNDGTGSVELNDQCLSVTPGVPVSWKALPQVEISGTDTLCLGDTTILTLKGAGDFPLKLIYSDGSQLRELPLLGAQVVTLFVSPVSTITYQLISVEDGSTPTCAVPLMDATTITVRQPADAGMANGPLQLCQGDDFPFQLINLLTDADFGGLWSDVSSPSALAGSLDPQVGTFQTAGQMAGVYRFRYTVTSAIPCPQDWEEVEVRLDPLPTADAGENKALNCDQNAVVLEGSSSDPAARFVWLFGADTVGLTPQSIVQDSGLYRLVVTSVVGCSATDTVRVDLVNQPPMATFLARGVRCHGDVTGVVELDSLISGEPPVLFSLDGNTFTPQGTFVRLPAGPYTVTLQDANGCEWISDTLLVLQPPAVQPDLGPDVQAHLGSTVTLTAGLSLPLSGVHTLTWKPLLDSVRINRDTQIFTPLQSWRVALEVVDSAGCRGRDEVWVLVDKSRHIFIPNIIALSSSENRVAMIYGGEDVVAVVGFEVFDRWGSLVFSRHHFLPDTPENGWDGRVNGREVAPGVYTWRAEVEFLDGQREVFFGDITVLR